MTMRWRLWGNFVAKAAEIEAKRKEQLAKHKK